MSLPLFNYYEPPASATLCDVCMQACEKYVRLADVDGKEMLSLCLGCLARLQISAGAVFRSLATKQPHLRIIR